MLSLEYLEDSFICNYDTALDNEYLQSIYLTYLLGRSLNDQELVDSALEEIKYLNQNIEQILAKEISSPEAYLLKLVDIGLDQRYLKIIENFQIPEYHPADLNISEKEDLLTRQDDLYFRQYLKVLQLTENAYIFREYGLQELADYFLNEAIQSYNSLGFGIYSLCNIGYVTHDRELFDYVKEDLEKILGNRENYLIQNSPLELKKCNMYAGVMNSEISNIKEGMSYALWMSTFTKDNSSFITDSSYVCMGDSDVCDTIQLNYRLLDNLKYVLYE